MSYMTVTMKPVIGFTPKLNTITIQKHGCPKCDNIRVSGNHFCGKCSHVYLLSN